MRWYLVGSSLGDLPKRSGSSLGTRREITGKKTRGLDARMLEATGLCGTAASSFRWVNHPYPPVPQNPSGGQQLSVGKPPVP
ncbi:hypothetical protein BHE74_00037277 [Ensete ventricosum]|uniref:Uncharacterized protein n=1 Tax=Ensete ventricosum TaxID=4639 RepID=A0A426WWB2_ENSVE|nr:hypothetical protein B296_00044202 [Ensete ventricosum]RWW56058.1 hypothetical protein BHE74_00037277 [Ensete ventricosum]